MTDRTTVQTGPMMSRRAAVTRWGGALAVMLALGPGTACSAPRAAEPDGDPPGPGDDDALLARILSGPRPLIPRRQESYRITRTLPLAGGRAVLIEGGTRIVWAGSPGKGGDPVAVFEAMGDDCSLAVVGDGVATVACETPSLTVYAAIMRGRRGFTVTGIQAEDCQHVHIFGAVADYASIRTAGPGSNIARDVRISGGGARFRSMPAGNASGACMLGYVANVHVADVRYENVTSGIQWWGGDAGLEPWQNGARVNERKCRDLLIERVAVRGARVGGVWGSMGRDVTVRDCSVEECLDVGFDAEGCDAVVFERCAARNGHNACFATFALCDGIRFVDCRGTVDNKGYPLFRSYNVTQSHADNRNIEVAGGRFECLDPTGPGVMDSAMGPVRELTIAGAVLTNVRIDTAYFNMHRTRIADNAMTFPAPLGTAAAIRAGASKGTPAEPGSVAIENNRIRYTAATGTPTAIDIVENDFNANAGDTVTGNIVFGPFAAGIVLTNATGNIGVVPAFSIAGNRFERLAPSARLLTVRQVGGARRPSVRWDQTQIRDGKAVALRAALGTGP